MAISWMPLLLILLLVVAAIGIVSIGVIFRVVLGKKRGRGFPVDPPPEVGSKR